MARQHLHALLAVRVMDIRFGRHFGCGIIWP
jgi:hypothetical protein